MAAEECSETFRDPRYRTYMSEREFGTFEASLMSATAVVLATHGHNCGHSDCVAEFSRPIHRELSLPDAEFELIKQHPVIGYGILRHVENLSYVLPEIPHHDEAMDGSGYANGFKDEEIPLYSRILAVADPYEAMTGNRPYRRGMPTDKAEAILRGASGNQWDPRCVDAFFRTVSRIRLLASQRSSTCLPTRSKASQTDSLELQKAFVNR